MIRRPQIAHSVFDGFSIAGTPAENTSTAETIKDFCDRGYKLIDALQANVPIGNSVYAALKTSIAELANRNLSPGDFDATNQAQQAFSAAQAREAETVFKLITEDSVRKIREFYDDNSRRL